MNMNPPTLETFVHKGQAAQQAIYALAAISRKVQKPRPKWKRTQDVHAGVDDAVGLFVIRARMALEYAREYLQKSRAGQHSAFDGYLRELTARKNWLHAARVLLANTHTGWRRESLRELAKLRAINIRRLKEAA
jgi:hypothetical protein